MSLVCDSMTQNSAKSTKRFSSKGLGLRTIGFLLQGLKQIGNSELDQLKSTWQLLVSQRVSFLLLCVSLNDSW